LFLDKVTVQSTQTLPECLSVLNWNFSKEQSMLPEDDRMI